jgi:1-phosphatidylinositol-4-phosphate 5-kinase
MSVTIHESQIMPSYATDTTDRSSHGNAHPNFSLPTRTSSDKSPIGRESGARVSNGTTVKMNGNMPNGSPSMQSVPNGRPIKPVSIDRRLSREEGPSSRSRGAQADAETLGRSPESRANSSELLSRDDGYFASVYSSKTEDRFGGTTHVKLGQVDSIDGTKEASKDFVPHVGNVSTMSTAQAQQSQSGDAPGNLHIPTSVHRVSSPPAFNHNTPTPSQHPYHLQQRHTLEVPKLSTSRARDMQNNTDDVISASGRFSPTAGGRRRGSMSLVRRTTRSINSDMHLDEVPQDDDAARWAEHIRQKRASKRKRKEDEDEDRVVVGTKVDQHHVNWVTAYNMLTGIRFTVSRTNAKMDRELTDADFDAKHKFSFDMYVPSGFPHLIKHMLEFSFESGWPVMFCPLYNANLLAVPAMSSHRLPSTTSSSRTMLHGSSAIFAPPSSWILPTILYH